MEKKEIDFTIIKEKSMGSNLAELDLLYEKIKEMVMERKTVRVEVYKEEGGKCK
jgi:hypothetical protein